MHIIEAMGVPFRLSTFVNARYVFWGNREVMIPEDPNANVQSGASGAHVVFDSSKERYYEAQVTPALQESLQKDCLAVQVWGHNIHMPAAHSAGGTAGLYPIFWPCHPLSSIRASHLNLS